MSTGRTIMPPMRYQMQGDTDPRYYRVIDTWRGTSAHPHVVAGRLSLPRAQAVIAEEEASAGGYETGEVLLTPEKQAVGTPSQGEDRQRLEKGREVCR